jgi:hypothetical protein
LRFKQQLDCLQDVRLVVGNQNSDSILPIGDGSPPQRVISTPTTKARRWKLRI